MPSIETQATAERPESASVLKADVFGRVERVDRPSGPLVRRVACGSRLPGSAWIARALLARERRALRALGGVAGVPELVERPELEAGDVLERSWIAGEPLHLATSLPADFFDHVDDLVARLHERGVCHNDLHKEQNVLVAEDGRPALVDFQLASVHARATRTFRARAREDLRHVEKHRRRYLRAGRGPSSAPESSGLCGAGHGLRRSWIAAAWLALGKPVYRLVTRGLLATRDGEARRPSSGPWPRWTAPLGAAGTAPLGAAGTEPLGARGR